jgi:ribosomal protein S18 acetylase RimI-like enzyme
LVPLLPGRHYALAPRRGQIDLWKRETLSEALSRHPSNQTRAEERHGDADNAALAAAGYNFRRTIKWLREFLRLFLAMLLLSEECRQA